MLLHQIICYCHGCQRIYDSFLTVGNFFSDSFLLDLIKATVTAVFNISFIFTNRVQTTSSRVHPSHALNVNIFICQGTCLTLEVVVTPLFYASRVYISFRSSPDCSPSCPPLFIYLLFDFPCIDLFVHSLHLVKYFRTSDI